jgi:mRNA-degrading endonuclease RelE of RelBE toxin-antitoxin system
VLREEHVTVQLTRGASRDLARLAPFDAKAVLDGIEAFARTGVGNVKKLRGVDPPTWCLRVGRFRALYRREGSTLVLSAVRSRRDAYR